MAKCKRIFPIIITLFYLISLASCTSWTAREEEYYRDRNNYISVTGVVDHIVYDEDSVYLAFSELTQTLDDNCFKIMGANYSIVKKNGIEDKLKLGNMVTFTTAPRYFGDGYIMPIVELSIGGEVLLEFDEGYENLMNAYDGLIP